MVDMALSIGDPKVPILSPIGSPAIAGDPALVGIVVAHYADGVIATKITGDVPVDAAKIGREVLENRKPGNDRPLGNCPPPRIERSALHISGHSHDPWGIDASRAVGPRREGQRGHAPQGGVQTDSETPAIVARTAIAVE